MKVYMPPEFSPAESHRAGVVLRDGYYCAVCGSQEALHAHHVIPRQVLRRKLSGAPLWAFEYAIADARNGMMLCPKHDPDRQANYRPGPGVVPDLEGLWDFAYQYRVMERLPL